MMPKTLNIPQLFVVIGLVSLSLVATGVAAPSEDLATDESPYMDEYAQELYEVLDNEAFIDADNESPLDFENIEYSDVQTEEEYRNASTEEEYRDVPTKEENRDVPTEGEAQRPRAPASSMGAGMPRGSIIAWIPALTIDDNTHLAVPFGWHHCDGSVIHNPYSPWHGQRAPDFRNRYLRGGDESNLLERLEDQIQDHEHVDRRHTHRDSGHTHTDRGHTHTDQGHTHRDTGHKHTDSGHQHTYNDRHLGVRGDICSGRYWKHSDMRRTTQTGKANIQTAYAQISSSKANLNSAKASLNSATARITTESSNVREVNRSRLGVRVGSETRPKSVYVMWIIKVV